MPPPPKDAPAAVRCVLTRVTNCILHIQGFLQIPVLSAFEFFVSWIFTLSKLLRLGKVISITKNCVSLYWGGQKGNGGGVKIGSAFTTGNSGSRGCLYTSRTRSIWATKLQFCPGGITQDSVFHGLSSFFKNLTNAFMGYGIDILKFNHFISQQTQ